MAIETLPLGNSLDFYHVSERFEVFERESALILDQLLAHMTVVTAIGEQLLSHPVLRARLRDRYIYDMDSDVQRRALLKILAEEVGRLALAYAQSLQLHGPEAEAERRQLLTRVQADIPDLRGDLAASHAAMRQAQAQSVVRWGRTEQPAADRSGSGPSQRRSRNGRRPGR